MTQDAYIQTCLHESAHAVVATALGIHVLRLAVDSVGDSTAGECFLALPTDAIHATAVLLAGTLGVNAFNHLLGNMPCNAPKQHHVESTHGQSCIPSSESSRVSANAWQTSPEPLGTGRDGYMIVDMLSALSDASQIFDRADRLCRKILAENCRVLMILTRRLAARGELDSADFNDVMAAVIPYSAGTI